MPVLTVIISRLKKLRFSVKNANRITVFRIYFSEMAGK